MVEENIGEDEILTSDGFYSKKQEDYKSIVLSCINQILKINTNLLSNTGKVFINIGGQVIEKEENTLKVFYQLVDTLEDLMYFFLDDLAKERIEKETEKVNKIYDKFFKIYLERQTSEARRYRVSCEQLIPKDDNLGKWCNEQIEEETKRCYRNKFREMCLLYKRKNDLSGRRIASY